MFLSANITGCSETLPERVAVSGTISLDGKPLTDADILFIPEKETKGPKARASIIDGKYHLAQDKGPYIGNMRVEIRSVGIDEAEFQQLLKEGKKPVIMKVEIPKYFNEKTRLHCVTKIGEENVFNYDLKKDKEDEDEYY